MDNSHRRRPSQPHAPRKDFLPANVSKLYDLSRLEFRKSFWAQYLPRPKRRQASTPGTHIEAFREKSSKCVQAGEPASLVRKVSHQSVERHASSLEKVHLITAAIPLTRTRIGSDNGARFSSVNKEATDAYTPAQCPCLISCSRAFCSGNPIQLWEPAGDETSPDSAVETTPPEKKHRDAALNELSRLFDEVARVAGKLPVTEEELKTSLTKSAADWKTNIDNRRKYP